MLYICDNGQFTARWQIRGRNQESQMSWEVRFVIIATRDLNRSLPLSYHLSIHEWQGWWSQRAHLLSQPWGWCPAWGVFSFGSGKSCSETWSPESYQCLLDPVQTQSDALLKALQAARSSRWSSPLAAVSSPRQGDIFQKIVQLHGEQQ